MYNLLFGSFCQLDGHLPKKSYDKFIRMMTILDSSQKISYSLKESLEDSIKMMA